MVVGVTDHVSQHDTVPSHRLQITLSVMLATVIQALDMTIANVSLPHMRGTLSATSDQISWVLTSYIVAAAIATPMTGFLASQWGRKRLFLYCVVGFTVASVLCGAAQTLDQIVLCRLLQGVFGAGLVPLSQSILLDTYPPSEHAAAMAMWGVGVMVGPILGPSLGGYLTEHYSWRWVFYINLPFGLLAFLGILSFVKETAIDLERRFDWTGFLWFSLALGSFQLMLDRGETFNWFESNFIRGMLLVSLLGCYEFLVHTLTRAQEHPFVDPHWFADRNFVLGLVLVLLVGALLLSTMALLPPFLQELRGYPVVDVGLILAPRGLGMMAAMLMVGKMPKCFDVRGAMLFGLMCVVYSLDDMGHFNLNVQEHDIVRTGLVQGLGLGFLFAPMNAMTFSTLPAKYRNDCTAIFSLGRNLGSSVAIALMVSSVVEKTQSGHALLSTAIHPFYLPWRYWLESGMGSETDLSSLMQINQEITRQAAANAYFYNFLMLKWLTIGMSPLVLLFKPKQHSAAKKTAAPTTFN